MVESHARHAVKNGIPKEMRKLAVLLGGLIVVMLPAIMFSPAISVQVQTESGDLVTCIPANRGAEVQLQFTHSMYGGYVRETWRITPSLQLERVRFVTENAAAAEYYATDGTSYRTGDGYLVPTDSLIQNELVIRVNTRGDHILTVGDSTAHLAGLVDTSTQVRITIAAESCSARLSPVILERIHTHARYVGR